jgi:hypothetical protein
MYSSNKRLTGMALTPTIFGHERRVCPVVLRDTGQCNDGKDVTSRSTSHIRQTMCDAAQDRQCGLGQELMWDLCLLPAGGLTCLLRPVDPSWSPRTRDTRCVAGRRQVYKLLIPMALEVFGGSSARAQHVGQHGSCNLISAPANDP